MRLVALAFVTIVACSGKTQTPAEVCAAAAKRGVDAMIDQARGRIADAKLPDDIKAQVQERQQRLESAGGKMRAVFTNRCVDDKWSSGVTGCYMKVISLEDMRACRKQLTAEQQARLQNDELELLAGPPAGSGAPVTGTGDSRLDMNTRAIEDARKGMAAAKTDEERAAAQAQLDTLEREKKQLEEEQ